MPTMIHPSTPAEIWNEVIAFAEDRIDRHHGQKEAEHTIRHGRIHNVTPLENPDGI